MFPVDILDNLASENKIQYEQISLNNFKIISGDFPRSCFENNYTANQLINLIVRYYS